MTSDDDDEVRLKLKPGDPEAGFLFMTVAYQALKYHGVDYTALPAFITVLDQLSRKEIDNIAAFAILQEEVMRAVEEVDARRSLFSLVTGQAPSPLTPTVQDIGHA